MVHGQHVAKVRVPKLVKDDPLAEVQLMGIALDRSKVALVDKYQARIFHRAEAKASDSAVQLRVGKVNIEESDV